MLKDYALIKMQPIGDNTTYYHPETRPEIVHLDSPAEEVMTDFQSKAPEVTIDSGFTHDALELMKQKNVKCLLVIDQNEHITGLISSRDISGVKQATTAQERGISPKEVTVNMVMTAKTDLQVLNKKDLQNVRVGHIVNLLQESDLQHILVVENNTEDKGEIVRGIFSLAQIERQLGEDILTSLRSTSVADMSKRI